MSFLHLPTLSAVALLTALLLPLLLFSVGGNLRDDPAARTWARGAALYSVGFVMVALRGLLPDLLGIVVRNLLLIGGYMELYYGVRQFFGRPLDRRAQLIVLPAFAVLMAWWTFASPNLLARVATFSFVMLIVTASLAREFFLARRTLPVAGSLGERSILNVLAGLFACSTGLLLARGGAALLLPASDSTAAELLDASAYVLAIVTNFMLAGALPLLLARRAQRELQQREQQLHRVQELAGLGSIEVNLRSGKIVTNAVLDRMFGVTPEHPHTQEAMFARIHPEDRERMQARIAGQLAGYLPGDGAEYRIVRADDGAVRWISAATERQTDPVDGSPLMLSTLRDITESKLAVQAAENALAAADAANRAKSDFLANMSHEVRTPLNGVLGMTQLLEHTPLTPEQQEYTRAISGSAQTLLRVVNDVLDFSKVEAGQLSIDPHPFATGELLDDLRTLFGAQAQANGVELTVQVTPGLPTLLVGDATRLRQILSNLLSNAIKFAPGGKVELIAVALPTASAERAEVELSVSDTGIGMNPETLSALFNPFFQADVSITRRFGGTGLGLSICQRLAALMGGKIDVESQLGVGSRFRLRLPFDIAVSPAPTSASASESNVAPSDFDVEYLLRHALNDHELACTMIDAALDDMAREADSLRAALAAGDGTSARRHAHTLKGLAAQLGGHGLAQAYRQFEAALQADTASAPDDARLDALESARQDFCARLAAWRATPQAA